MELSLPDDVVGVIIAFLLEPLRQDAVRSNSRVYAYFSLCWTSKQFERVCKRVHEPLDWFRLLDNPHSNYNRFLYNIRSEKPPSEQSVKMIRTLTFYDSGLPVIRKQIDRFMGLNQLVYRTRGSGKLYKGYVSVRKLKTIKAKPKQVNDQFKELLKRHEAINKKRLLLVKQLIEYSKVVWHRVDKTRRELQRVTLWADMITK